MAHALHPNYADKHDPDLAPRLGSGLVLKHNVNQRYATTSISATLFRWEAVFWVVGGGRGQGKDMARQSAGWADAISSS